MRAFAGTGLYGISWKSRVSARFTDVVHEPLFVKRLDPVATPCVSQTTVPSKDLQI